MKTTTANPTPGQDPAWLALGELLLPFGENPDELINRWLEGLLEPLELSGEFRGRVIHSAKETAAQALQADPPGAHNEPISLRIFFPKNAVKAGKTWGYFSIVKNQCPENFPDQGSPAVCFYLYLEGD